MLRRWRATQLQAVALLQLANTLANIQPFLLLLALTVVTVYYCSLSATVQGTASRAIAEHDSLDRLNYGDVSYPCRL